MSSWALSGINFMGSPYIKAWNLLLFPGRTPVASIYTCPNCRRRFTIYRDGDYLCECGKVFFYPPLLSSEKACFISLSRGPELKQKPRDYSI